MNQFANLRSPLPLAIATLALTLGTASAQETPTIRIGVVKFAGYSTAMVALQEGMFAKNGVKAILTEFGNAGEAVAANRAGHIDVITQTPGNIMQANEQGFDLVALLQNETAKAAPPDSGAIIVLKDSNIKSLADLEGKRIAVSLLAGQNSVAFLATLQKAGVDKSKVVLLEVPPPSAVDTLKGRQVEAVSAVDPYTTQLLRTGVGRVISWTYIDSIPEQPLGVWTVRKVFIDKNPELAAKVAASLKDAIEYMNADPVRARRKVAEFTGLDPALIADMPAIRWSYEVRRERWQAVMEMMATTGALGKGHSVDEYLNGPIRAYVTP